MYPFDLLGVEEVSGLRGRCLLAKLAPLLVWHNTWKFTSWVWVLREIHTVCSIPLCLVGNIFIVTSPMGICNLSLIINLIFRLASFCIHPDVKKYKMGLLWWRLLKRKNMEIDWETVSPDLVVIYGSLDRMRARRHCFHDYDFRRAMNRNGKSSPKNKFHLVFRFSKGQIIL